MGLDLREFRKPLEDVTFPNGAKHQPVPFGPTEYQLWRDLQKLTDPVEAGQIGIAIIRACYPTVTDEDILDCDAEMLFALAAYPGGKIEQVRNALKNAAREEPEKDPPTVGAATSLSASSPKTNGSTSSSESPEPSGETGGTSKSAGHTDDPSSSGSATTSSPTLSASTS